MPVTDYSTYGSEGLKPVLIFPGGMPRALDHLQRCLTEGIPVVGASSLGYDVASSQYPAWCHLPFVNTPEFDAALQRAINNHGIGSIFSPNPVAWDYLQRRLASLAPGVRLVNASPVNEMLISYRASLRHARALLACSLALASPAFPRSPLSENELAALFRHADTIPGMCDNEKICALHEIARASVAGDVVEIGSWWGKSAFVLARLALCFEVGKLLCVDPWSNDHLVQDDGKSLVDSVSAQVDAVEALGIFEINLLPYNANHVNDLRMTSTEAARHYRIRRSASTPAFGTTQYRGEISILHIDGNHSYGAASADIAAWSDLILPGGWMIIDDYIWPFGDGPRTAGDEFLAANLARISTAFVMGSALFLQFGETTASS